MGCRPFASARLPSSPSISQSHSNEVFRFLRRQCVGLANGCPRDGSGQAEYFDDRIPLNIAEGNGKRSQKDRARFLDIARGSSFECAAIQDILVASGGMNRQSSDELKRMLKRVVSMLTRMAMKFDGVADSPADHARAIDYEYEHREAEHEHDWCAEPEPSRPPEPGLRPISNGQPNFPAR